jgi:hypothetical protein
MPVEKQMVMCRADWDTATSYGSYWVGKAKISLADKRIVVTDLYGDLANKDDLLVALANVDPMSFWGMGHGNETQFAGQNNAVLLEKGVDEELMLGRIVHLTACLTGKEDGLLYSFARAGAIACFGYKVEFIVGVETPNFPETPDNDATKSLMKPDVVIEYALADGKTCAEALEVSDIASEIEIESWRQSGHPDSDLLIFSLISNRDGKVLYGMPEAVSRVVAPPLNVLSVLSVLGSVAGLGLVMEVKI